MKESYVEGLASHIGPESCVSAREGEDEALTGVRAGQALSRERCLTRDADPLGDWGRPHPQRRYREALRGPARSETLCTYGNTPRENREIPRPPAADGAAGRIGKSMDAIR